METITSRKNPYIKELAAIKKEKSDNSFAIIEGKKLISEAYDSGFIPITLLVSETYRGDVSEFCGTDTRVIKVNDTIIDMLSSTNTPQGIIALIKRRPKADINAADIKEGIYLILERVSDPGNVGTIIRTSEAFGAAGVILCAGCADVYNDKTLRSTMGSAFRQNIMYADSAVSAIAALKNAGIRVYAAALLKTAECLGRERFSGSCAFVIGNESAGVSEEAISVCDSAITIPMTGKTESLNAAVAASVILWEVFRQKLN